MASRVLGLDLGPNSIGWALLELEDSSPKGITACGSRIFQEAVDAKTRTPKNKERRDARSARRRLARRKMRRDTLTHLLVKEDLLPDSPDERKKILEASDPYALRRRGLDTRLSLHEFGRALFHLNQRRGFQSNRKASGSEEERQEEGKIKKAVSELSDTMKSAGARTLGEYLFEQPKKRCHYTSRDMYEDEFNKLWEAQKKHHPEVLTDPVRVRVHKVIFFQRPLKVQKFLVGKCSLEPSRKRCSWARPEAQRFRTLQDINHLTVRNPITRHYRPLTQPERDQLANRLETQATMAWSRAQRLLGLHEGETFNLQEGGSKKHLTGNRTLAAVHNAAPGLWARLDETQREAFLEDLFSILKEETLLKRLTGHWGLSHEQANALATIEFQPGYANLSLKAIRSILPHLENGLNYHDACQAAGYLRDDQKPVTATESLPAPPGIRNPVVSRALHQVRRVVNAIIRRYGKPDEIHVELARDLKLTKKQKDRLQRQNTNNRKLNDEARECLQKLSIPDSGEARLKYRLWKEQKGICPYSGECIGKERLFSSDVEIDHILPYSRIPDDSYMNKVVCLAGENRDKRDATPHEKWSDDDERYEQILQRVRALPLPKRRKFEQEEINLDDFISRQLNETRYISREVKNYLRPLVVNSEKIQVSTGQTTAILRRAWDLEKDRADHWHHAIDAIVIALTSRSLFHRIASTAADKQAVLGQRRFDFSVPWEGFASEVTERIDSLVVSHAPTRKIVGALHEETAYGEVTMEGEKVYVRRVPLESLKAKMADKIVDRRIRALVQDRLAAHGGNTKKAFADPLYLEHTRKGTGRTQIRRVRIANNLSNLYHVFGENGGRPIKSYVLGNNHHVEIIEHVKTGRRKGIFVTTMDIAHRVRRQKLPPVQRDHGPDWTFVMSLTANDTVQIEDNGKTKTYRVQKISKDQIVLRLHNAATLDDTSSRLLKTPNTLRCTKVTVDPLGNAKATHD